MLRITWLCEPEFFYLRGSCEDAAPPIIGWRRAEHADLPTLERFIRMETHESFGNLQIHRIYEEACLSIVQFNEKADVVSGVLLCNYPNVPAVPSNDWLNWLNTLYGVDHVTLENTLFVHMLVWDPRYKDFFGGLLTGLFDAAPYLYHVILVLPPGVEPAGVFENQMVRFVAKGPGEDYSVQSLLVSRRYRNNPRLKVRRVVEEDNDEVIPIINAESSKLKEFYGDYYISEMVRHPDERRRLIVSEDDDGLATGVMFLNRTIEVDILNENFELGPYHGLRKHHEKDEVPADYLKPASEIFEVLFSKRLGEILLAEFEDTSTVDDQSSEAEEGCFEDVYRKRETLKSDNVSEERSADSSDDRSLTERLEDVDMSRMTFLSDLPSIADYFSMYHRSKMRISVFADAVYAHPRRSSAPAEEIPETQSFHHVTDIPSSPVYHGERNAFVLEVFAVRRDIKQRWYRHFLDAAFECFPDLDYCVILLPFSHHFFPLLKYFVRVPLRCNKDFPMTMYVTHRAAFLGEIRYREGNANDREGLASLVNDIPKGQEILADFDRAMNNPDSDIHCCVIECNDTIVGAVVLCAEKNPTFIKRRYHVEDYIAARNVSQDAYGRVLHFVLMPVFSVRLRAFFREIMSLTGFTVLYYRLEESALSAMTRSHPLATCLTAMVPVTPRQRIEYKFRGYTETDEPETEEGKEYFSLYMTTPRLTSFPISIIDMKIVVVGASDCGVAFLEYFALGSTQHFQQFANLTVISPNGLPFETKHDRCSAQMIPFKGRYCYEYRHVVATRAWINVIYGTVIGIHRKRKYVMVLNQGNITYDYLILTCGLQYQRPRFQEELEAQQRGELVDYETPWNCLTINDETEAFVCLEKMRLLTDHLQYRKTIIFYGHSIDCYCAIQGLLEFGVNGSWITLIQPPLRPCDSHDNIFHNDCEVDGEVMNSILRSGIVVLQGWKLIGWFLRNGKKRTMIESITIESKGKTRRMGCDVLFNFDEKAIDTKIFLAICRSGLVFDGQLVIDPECRTNDPFIFAAGTVTKYSRKFHGEPWEHKYYNSIEVGESLAKIIRTAIDIRQRDEEMPEPESKSKVLLTFPTFRMPNILACILPGGYHYLHVRKPGKTVLRSVAIRYDFYGEVMITGTCTSDIGYFRIRLNHYRSVETVTCLSKKTFEVRQLIALYGKHESMLNELKTRFDASLISDFYAYFREPWATAIFYDKFECLQIENRATLLSRTGEFGDSLVGDCVRAFVKSDWEAIAEKDRMLIQAKYPGSVYHQEVEQRVLDFLQCSQDDLPMYCTPDRLREMYADTDDSPLFTDI